MSIAQRNGARIVAVHPSLHASLRQQTLVVLEFNHHPFEELRALSSAEQLAAAQTFRDAFAVLDALGWDEPAEPRAAAPVDVPFTPGHIAHLRVAHHDLTLSIRDRLALHAERLTAHERQHLGAEIVALRTAAADLAQVILLAGSTGQ